jgi:spermidine/putrescine transport system permease protein
MSGVLGRRVGTLVAALYLFACYVFIFLPVGVLVLFSFQDGRLPVPPFHGPTLAWYGRALGNDRLMAGLGNSLMVGVVSSAISVVLGFLAAYGISRYAFPGRRLLQAFIVLPLAVSYLLIGMGILVTVSAFGLSPSLPMVVIGHVVINMPLAFAITLAQLGEHQRRMEWAARDLGASTPRILLTIVVPLIAPALIAAFCLCFTLSWDEFLIAFLVTRFDVTLPVVIWTMLRGGLNPQTNAVGSIIFVCSILLVIAVEALLFGKRRA